MTCAHRTSRQTAPAPLRRSSFAPRNRCTAALFACAAFVLVAIAGCDHSPGKPGAGPLVQRPEQVLNFPTLYAQNCAACHGVNGRSGAAISLNNAVYLAIAGAANIQQITANGVPRTAMPPFAKSAGGMLTDQQIAALTNGMIAAWGKPDALNGQSAPPYATSTPANAAQGRQTFTAYCAQCHGTDGSGGHSPGNIVTGSLVDPSYLALTSDQDLRSFILAGITEQGTHDWISYSPSHPLTDADTTNLVTWLTSHRVAAPGQPYKQQ